MTEPIRILAPVEIRDSAAGAGRLIAALFPAAATEVHVFHVDPVAVSAFFIPPGIEGLDSLRREQLAAHNRLAEKLRRKFGPLERRGMRVFAQATSGSPLSEILRQIAIGHYDLVVTGVGARPGSLGGVAAGLLHASPAPILLFRGVRPGFRVRQVVFSTDFSPCSRKATSWAILVAALTGAPLQIVHIGPENGHPWAVPVRDSLSRLLDEEIRLAREEAARLAIPMPPANAILRHAESPAEGILEAAGEGSLVVLGTAGRTGLGGVIGSVARRVARSCVHPVLAVGPSIRSAPAETWKKAAPRALENDLIESCAGDAARRD